MTETSRNKALYVGHTNPWGPFSGSGFSPNVCSRLIDLGLLSGGIQPFDPESFRYQNGRGYNSIVNRVLRKFKKRMDMGLVDTENDGYLPKFLEQLDPGSPVIYHFHTPEYDDRWQLERYLFQDLTPSDAFRYDAYGHKGMTDAEVDIKREKIRRVVHSSGTAGIMTYSSYGADSIAAEYDYPREKIMAIGCGPVRSAGLPENLTVERYRSGRILFVGRSWEKKGGPIILDALRILRGSPATKHAKLTIIGPRIQPEETVGEPGVEFLGRVSDKEVAEAFEKASLFCMAPDCETWGIVYVEAANAGLPIVGFKRWALPDIVTDGETGYLIGNRNHEELADGLSKVISNPELAFEMGVAANKRVDRVLGWDHVINRMIKMIWPELAEERNVRLLQSETTD